MALDNGSTIAVAFIGGFIAALLLLAVAGVALLKTSDAYFLSHWKLNVKMPLCTMWMNLGYWVDASGEPIVDFEEACSTLLKEILRTAGLLKPPPSAPDSTLSILDLGFGCGDQITRLLELLHHSPSSLGSSRQVRYVGLTLDHVQVASAKRFILPKLLSQPSPPSIQLFQGNAAKPELWSRTTSDAVKSLSSPSSQSTPRTWLLALDCLYYFSPSRKPIISFTHDILHGNIMVFDLLLNPDSSAIHKFMARVVGKIMGCPWSTFMTEVQYRKQLVECGYDVEMIQIRDITEHVFSGVSQHIERRDRELSKYGISLGGFALAGRLFAWFERTAVVKAVIVVARHEDEM